MKAITSLLNNIIPDVDISNQSAVNPAHYRQGKIECIDAIEAALSKEEFIGYLRGNIMKYNWRCLHKGGLQDVKKAQWYTNRLIKTLENED